MPSNVTPNYPGVALTRRRPGVLRTNRERRSSPWWSIERSCRGGRTEEGRNCCRQRARLTRRHRFFAVDLKLAQQSPVRVYPTTAKGRRSACHEDIARALPSRSGRRDRDRIRADRLDHFDRHHRRGQRRRRHGERQIFDRGLEPAVAGAHTQAFMDQIGRRTLSVCLRFLVSSVRGPCPNPPQANGWAGVSGASFD